MCNIYINQKNGNHFTHSTCDVEAMVTLSVPTLSNHQVFIFKMDRSDTTSYIYRLILVAHNQIYYITMDILKEECFRRNLNKKTTLSYFISLSCCTYIMY